MPRIEFETKEQRVNFEDWLGRRNVNGRVEWIIEVELPGLDGGSERILEVLKVDGEPMLIEVERDTRKQISADISERTAMILRDKGIIFERGSHVSGPPGSSELQTTQVSNIGDQV